MVGERRHQGRVIAVVIARRLHHIVIVGDEVPRETDDLATQGILIDAPGGGARKRRFASRVHPARGLFRLQMSSAISA
jgi:hypothetical protein